MQQYNLGDYRGGRENLSPLLAQEMQAQQQDMAHAAAYGLAAAQSAMGRKANSQLLAEKMGYQMQLQDQASAAQNALYERQRDEGEVTYQHRQQEAQQNYQNQFAKQQAEFDRQQGIISQREDTKYNREKSALDEANQIKNEDFRQEMAGAHKALIDYHTTVLNARRPEDPDYQTSAKFLQGLTSAEGQNPWYIKGLLEMHMKQGINPFGLGQLGMASAKPAQIQPQAQNKPKPRRALPQDWSHPDDKYNQ